MRHWFEPTGDGRAPDMRKNDHVRALPAADGAAAEGPQSTRADIHHLTEPICRKGPFGFFPSRACEHALPGSGRT